MIFFTKWYYIIKCRIKNFTLIYSCLFIFTVHMSYIQWLPFTVSTISHFISDFNFKNLGGNEEEIFKVDQNTGSVSTLKTLPPTNDEYHLKILANMTAPANGTNKLCQQNKINIIDVSILVNRKMVEQQALLMIKNHSRISLGLW